MADWRASGRASRGPGRGSDLAEREIRLGFGDHAACLTSAIIKSAWVSGVESFEDDEEKITMAYQPDDDGMNEQQKEERKQAKNEREQLKKDRDAQRAKIRKDRLPAK
jgi:hypothetical protein